MYADGNDSSESGELTLYERKGSNSSVLSAREVVSFEDVESSSRTGVLKVWSVGPRESRRPFQEVRVVKTVYMVMLR